MTIKTVSGLRGFLLWRFVCVRGDLIVSWHEDRHDAELMAAYQSERSRPVKIVEIAKLKT